MAEGRRIEFAIKRLIEARQAFPSAIAIRLSVKVGDAEGRCIKSDTNLTGYATIFLDRVRVDYVQIEQKPTHTSPKQLM